MDAKLQLGATFPGEQLAVEIVRSSFDAYIKTRETMSQENRDRTDKLRLDFQEDMQRALRNFWVLVGVLDAPKNS